MRVQLPLFQLLVLTSRFKETFSSTLQRRGKSALCRALSQWGILGREEKPWVSCPDLCLHLHSPIWFLFQEAWALGILFHHWHPNASSKNCSHIHWSDVLARTRRKELGKFAGGFSLLSHWIAKILITCQVLGRGFLGWKSDLLGKHN